MMTYVVYCDTYVLVSDSTNSMGCLSLHHSQYKTMENGWDPRYSTRLVQDTPNFLFLFSMYLRAHVLVN